MEKEEKSCLNCINFKTGECNGNETNAYTICDGYSDGRNNIFLKDKSVVTKKEADFLAGVP